jgi:MoaA/NifB/PqqE/SkfB family radical SAM enzyme
MSFKQASALLGSLRNSSIDNVVFGGGEPFLWPHDLERLSRNAQDLGFLVQVCTNGAALPDGFERVASVDRYILPLEAMDPVVHDAMRRHRDGHHALVLERIAALRGSRRELTVSTVVTRANLDRLSQIADYLMDVKSSGVAVHAWHLYRFLPVGRGGALNAERLEIGRGEFRRACTLVRERNPDLRVFRRDDMLRSSTVEFFWFENGRLQTGSEAIKLDVAG